MIKKYSPILSFIENKNGTPIAINNYDSSVLYLYEEDKSIYKDHNIDIIDYLSDDMFYDKKKRQSIKCIDKNKIIRALKLKQDDIVDEHLSDVYLNIKKLLYSKINQEVIINSGDLHFLPNNKLTESSRQVVLISGASGSGKSYWCADYADQYHTMFPKNVIYLFSKKDEDAAFDKYKYITRILLDDSFLEGDPLSYKDFKNSLMIFDDIDTLEGQIFKEISQLRSDVLQLGRSSHINVCITTHIACNYGKTKEIINESTHYVIFRGCNKLNTSRLLTQYVGIDPKKLQDIWNLPSRWTLISKNYPTYILYSSGCFLIK